MLDFGRLLDPQLLMSAELLVDPGLIQNKFKPVQDNISSFFFIHFLLLESVGSKMNLENNNRKIEDREVLEFRWVLISSRFYQCVPWGLHWLNLCWINLSQRLKERPEGRIQKVIKLRIEINKPKRRMDSCS